MMPRYWWDVDKYPSCEGPLTIQQILDLVLSRESVTEEPEGETEEEEND